MKKIALVILALMIFCFTSCNDEKQKFTEYSFEYFDTVTTIVGYENDKEDFDARCGEIFNLLGEYHKLFTIYNRYENFENLCTVNELKWGEHRTVELDFRVIDMLLYAKGMYGITYGNMNVAMGSVLSIWHDYRSEGMDDPANAKLPPDDALIEAAKYTDIENIVIDTENSTVTITEPNARLDVGAIAKGYAVEMAARINDTGSLG